MGFDYTYHLHIPRENVWSMLQTLGHHAPHAHRPSTLLHLASGAVLDIPFTSHFETNPLFYTEQTLKLKFDTSLQLRIDQHERALFRAEGFAPNKWGMLGFGYLYLTNDFRPASPGDFVVFDLRAATNGMSRLMKQSRSLYRVFGAMLAENNGICVILDLDREDREAILWWFKGKALFHPLLGSMAQLEHRVQKEQA